MFQARWFRINQLDTSIYIKIIQMKLYFMFLPKYIPFYNYITTQFVNQELIEENIQLFHKYHPLSQYHTLASPSKDSPTLVTHKTSYKLYYDYLDHHSYKLTDNGDYKFFINKYYKHKQKYLRTKKTQIKWISSEALNFLKYKKKKNLSYITGQARALRVNFFKNHWVHFTKKIHRLDYKISCKSKQYSGYMHLALKQFSRISRFSVKPYKNKKLLKKKSKKKTKSKFKKKKSNRKRYYIQKKKNKRTFKTLQNNWLHIKRPTPVVRKKQLTLTRNILNRGVRRASIRKLKNAHTTKYITALTSIAIKTNNYNLYRSILIQKSKVKNHSAISSVHFKKKKITKKFDYFFKKNKNKRIRWNTNIQTFNKLLHNVIELGSKTDYFKKIFLFSIYLKETLKTSLFKFKKLKQFSIAKKIFTISYSKNKKKKLKKKKIFFNKTKKIIYFFYKNLKKKLQTHWHSTHNL